MKTILPLLIAILLFSCSKNNDTTSPTFPPPIDTSHVVIPDTLTTGWTKINQPGFVDIYFASNLVGYGAVNGQIFKSTDAGLTWNIIHNTGQIINISGTPDGKIFFVGYMAQILYTTNAGASFDSTAVSVGSIIDCYFTDNNNGYAVNQTSLFQTSNAGVTWSQVSPLGVNFPGSYVSLFFINNSAGWIISGPGLYRPNGSINTWVPATFNGEQPVTTSRFTGIYAPDADNVYAVMDGGQLFKSTDAGVNFSLLHSFYPANSFADVHFVDAETGYISIERKIYKTTDAGTTWQPVVSLASGNWCTEIHFIDANNGWACTQNAVFIFKQ